MTNNRKPLTDAKTQQQLDALPLHVRSMLLDEMRKLREVRELPENPTKGSWI